MWSISDPSTAVLATSVVTFVSGFMLGVYTIRGYLISPALAEERRRNFDDPEESEASDVDEDDTVLDHAPNWDNGLDADRQQGLRVAREEANGEKKKKKKKTAAAAAGKNGGGARLLPPTAAASEARESREECKLVLVVRTDLGMTKGKIAAQCGHATLACYKTLSEAGKSKKGKTTTAAGEDNSEGDASAARRMLSRWERNGQPKIAVQIKSEDELLELMGKARSLGVTAEVIADAGRTQIEAGSLTVLGVGPAPKSLVDQITGHLKLL